ncbi:peptidyl-prolyl cis-trans isomerase [Aestuariicella sp. G3-2]|uniref:peptidylprolyl isomerase n=1 Tax=Pseudomaricurvus albidus TaxID=2842452 RepID=UPI001C0A9D98|nr:peptidylprolyl isomerase [Aestuariicella albida]MBU3068795.1 peptidyl-prolyl cis-trans isomerase [Aestuariicella albida]
MDTNVRRRWLKEPLFHFLLIGACLFGLYALIKPVDFRDDNTIVVDQNRIDYMKARYERTWNRQPTAAELDALIDNYIVEEILYRQALAMGLDKNDSVIRRRMQQKMEFFTADSVDLLSPSDADLEAYLQAHTERFIQPSVFSFEQIYISTDLPADTRDARIAEIQAQLAAGKPVQGSASTLPRDFSESSALQVDRQFGQGFADQIEQLPLNQWSAPIRSGLGLHIVKVTRLQKSYLPPLAEIRSQVQREWQTTKRRELKTAMIENLKENYAIVIEAQDQNTLPPAANRNI